MLSSRDLIIAQKSYEEHLDIVEVASQTCSQNLSRKGESLSDAPLRNMDESQISIKQ
jgi:hypothetical protein